MGKRDDHTYPPSSSDIRWIARMREERETRRKEAREAFSGEGAQYDREQFAREDRGADHA